MLEKKIKVVRSAAIKAILTIATVVIAIIVLGIITPLVDPSLQGSTAEKSFEVMRGTDSTMSAVSTGNVNNRLSSVIGVVLRSAYWIVILSGIVSLFILSLRTRSKLIALGEPVEEKK